MKRTEIFIETVKCDLSRWGEVSFRSHLKFYFLKGGYKILFRHRLCSYLSDSRLKLLCTFEKIHYMHLCRKYGCSIPTHVKIGKGLKIIHTNGLIINSKTVIGDNVTIIGANTLIGGTEKSDGAPNICDDVLIGGNATLIGQITIGKGASVGAGALVVHDVNEKTAVVSKPATILNKKVL